MTTFTELFSAADHVKRLWFRSTTLNAATVSNITIPAGAKCAIISGVGAGGWKTSSDKPGGGAAFARTKLTDLVTGEQFTVQVGSTKFSLDAGSSQGDSIVTRVSGATVVMKAVRGTGTLTGNLGQPGLASNCVGDTKRDGLSGTYTKGVAFPYLYNGPDDTIIKGGVSGGDLNDIYSLGFGTRGARWGRWPAAGPGGGGIHNIQIDYATFSSIEPGAGLVCIDLFTKDPGLV